MFEDIRLVDLVDEGILAKLQEGFAKMARMAVITVDVEGKPIVEGTHFSDYCLMCRGTEVGKARCEGCNKELADKSFYSNKAEVCFCYAKMINFAAPIMLGNEMIGSLVAGQILTSEVAEEDVRTVAGEIGIDADRLVDASKSIQIIPEAAVVRTKEFLLELSQTISRFASNSYKMHQLRNEAMQAAIQKSDFLANMSHEIRTPMNAVLGMAEMALREDMSEEARQYVRQIQSSGKHLLTIINDILDFSKIDSGKMEIVETPYETLHMIQDISNLINSRIGVKDIEFIVDVPYNMPAELIGDNIRIQQILINLLGNAVKFTQRGKIVLSLSFDRIDDANVMFKAEVSDTGSGIKEKDLQNLFESFYQVDSKRNRNIEGTGLGLAITKQLLGIMNGKINVESEYGKGSKFTVSFPQQVYRESGELNLPKEDSRILMYVDNLVVKEQIKKDLEPTGISIVDGTEENYTSSDGKVFIIVEKRFYTDEFADSHPEVKIVVVDKYDGLNDIHKDNVCVVRKPVSAKQLYAALGFMDSEVEDYESSDSFAFEAPEAHVLIVDDNAINLSVAKGLLEPLHMNVDTVESAAACIEALRKEMYDIILMDHMMPEVDGIEATHIIRRLIPGYEDVPIIALTANAVGGAKEMFIREGMNDFVAKPIETKTIVDKIRKWLPEEKIVLVDKSQIVEDKEDETLEDDVQRIVDMDIAGMNVRGAIKLLGNEKLYLQILKEYYLAIDGRSDIIKNSYESKDYQRYTIEVHSLKSTSRQIGADNLASLAAQLEKAGNNGDIAFIDNKTDELIEDYMKLQEVLEQIFPDAKVKVEHVSADKESTILCLNELVEALNEMDTLMIDDVIEKFGQFDFADDAEVDMFEQLRGAAEEYDIDTCLQIAGEWQKYLK